jgi:hypothetical protein
MKKPADFAIIVIGINVLHHFVLSKINFIFFELLGGIINLALVGVMVFMIMARGKDSAPAKGSSAPAKGPSAADFGTSAPTS